MPLHPNRRQFLLRPACGLAGLALASPGLAGNKVERDPGANFTLSLNIYSFNTPLRAGEITISDVIDFCAANNLTGLDATGYYFPGYPDAPPDDYVYTLKRQAFLNGVTIHGTGVRTDFAEPDASVRKKDIQLTKRWVDVAVKLGASEIRIFSGHHLREGHSFDQTLKWMAKDIRECVDYAGERGIMTGLQNHNDALKTADETIRLVEAVGSKWFGVKLDIGSFEQRATYGEIAKLLPYATSWQLKENVWVDGKQVPTDYPRLMKMIRDSGYRGWVPIESLGPGDPAAKVKKLLARVQAAM